jgi:hypothetical protein
MAAIIVVFRLVYLRVIAQRELVAIRERGWLIIGLDGDGAVCDLARQCGHWASPFCSA